MISLYNIEKILFITFLNHLGSTLLIPHLQKKVRLDFFANALTAPFLLVLYFLLGSQRRIGSGFAKRQTAQVRQTRITTLARCSI